jgi:hypothetical protein
MSFGALIDKGAPIDEIGAHLDGLSAKDRVREVLALDGRQLEKLFELCKGKSAVTMEEFVPRPEETIIFELKNGLPMFNYAQKRFFRPKDGEVVGYNHNGAFATYWVGPGYFFARNGDDGELLFDYTRLPTLQPPGWPEIKPNKTGLLPRVTYADMIDYARRVSKHTVIGAAFRHGKPRNQYFILTLCEDQS